MSEQRSGGQPPPEGTSGGALPAYPVRAGRRRRGPLLTGVAVAVAAVLGATTFALASSAGDPPADPEAAVEALFAAVEDRDVLGVLDSLAPAERASLQPFVEDLAEELKRLDVLSDDLELGSVDGFELDVRDLTLSSRELAEGIAVVSIDGGALSTTVRPEEVPLGDVVREWIGDAGGGLDEVTTTTDLVDGERVELVVVEDDGWHVSLGYTLAEAARVAAGAPLPDFGAGVAPAGADSPEGVVEAVVQAGTELDVERLIALLAPGEASALHDYAPLFLPEAEAAIAEVRAATSFDISVDDLQTEVERDGDVASVRITAFAVSGQIDGEPFSVSSDGECVHVSAAGIDEEQCPGDLGATAGPLPGLNEESALVVVEVDGVWYLSPVRTVTEGALAFLGILEPQDLRDPQAAVSRLLGGAGPFAPGMGLGAPELDGGAPDDAELEGWGAEVDGSDELEGFEDGGSGDRFAACAEAYAKVPAEASAEAWEQADADFDQCLEEAGAG